MRQPSLKPDNKTVLEQSLAALPQLELVQLLLQFAAEDENFQRKLLEKITIPARIIQSQPLNPQLVTRLIKEIKRFFANLNDLVDPYYETGPLTQIEDFLNEIQLLNPQDQLLVIPQMLKAASVSVDDYPISTEQLGEAFVLYGKAASLLNLTPLQKEGYLEQLLNWLDELEIWEYGAETSSVLEGLKLLATTPQDYAYLIQSLQTQLEANPAQKTAELVEWQAAFYLLAGAESQYLAIRQSHLENESQYYELADYWQKQNQPDKYLATLESWLEKLKQARVAGASETGYNRPAFQGNYSAVLSKNIYSGFILEQLSQYYQQIGDQPNLLRILIRKAEEKRADFELYREIKPLAQRLGQWVEVKAKYLSLVRHDDRTLAQIYLFEQEWALALALAQKQKPYRNSVIDLLGQGLKEIYPKEVIELYQKMVAENLAEANRKNYQIAAGYAAKIKEIYLKQLKEPENWQKYVGQIRAENKRRPALQDEFKGL